jgi:uncharacterized protein involved in exopolysaccharide biosynthesis
MSESRLYAWLDSWWPFPEARRTVPVVVRFAVLGLLIGGASGFLRARTWTASISFSGQSGEALNSRIAGLAAQFGVAVPSSERVQSPEYFAELVRSGRVLGNVADRAVPVAGSDSTKVSLARLLDIDTTQGVATTSERTLRALDKLVRTSTGLRTGVVRVTVRMPDARAAVHVASALVAEANAVAVQMRQEQARIEREYAERQVRELERRLTLTEDSLIRFSRANREYINESALSLTRARLVRSVESQRAVLTSVTQSVEQARLTAVRDTPNLTVVDPPRLPVQPDGRGTVLRAMLGVLTGMLAGALFLVLRAPRRVN